MFKLNNEFCGTHLCSCLGQKGPYFLAIFFIGVLGVTRSTLWACYNKVTWQITRLLTMQREPGCLCWPEPKQNLRKRRHFTGSGEAVRVLLNLPMAATPQHFTLLLPWGWLVKKACATQMWELHNQQRLSRRKWKAVTARNQLERNKKWSQ